MENVIKFDIVSARYTYLVSRHISNKNKTTYIKLILR